MKSKIKLVTLSLLIIFLICCRVVAQNNDLYKLQFNNGMVQKAISFELKNDSIIYYDLFKLEHIIKKSRITLIQKIQNQKKTFDVINLMNDSTKEGIIIRINPSKNVVLFSQSNDTIFIPVKNFKSISKQQIIIQNNPVNKFEIGVSLGFPSAVNLMTAFWLNNIGVRLSGLYIGIAKGVQFNLCYKFLENKNKYHSIALVIGNSDIEKDKFGRIYLKNFHWQYTGIVYDLNIKHFWSEIGFSYGFGNYKNPQIIFQIGYSTEI